MKVELKLTEREIGFLKQYASVYKKERTTDCTADPIVLVQDRYKEYTNGEYVNDGFEYELMIDEYPFTEDSLISDFSELKKELEDILLEYELTEDTIQEIINDIGIEFDGFCSSDEFEETYENIEIYIKKHYYKYVYKTIAYFFTRIEAEKYLKYQRHNLHKPRVFTDYAGYQNRGDFPELQKMLLRLGNELNEVQE